MELKFIDRKGNIVIKPKQREIKNRISVYGIAILKNKVFLVKPAWINLLELPGGGVVSGENIEEGLKREFLEETGFFITMKNKIPIWTSNVFFYADDIDIFFNSKVLFYLVSVNGKKNSFSADKNEIKESGWYDLNELKRYKKKVKDLHFKAVITAIRMLEES
jgi:8-oxo-dGTP pyrophosphatase MutT (NUDIX family)